MTAEKSSMSNVETLTHMHEKLLNTGK